MDAEKKWVNVPGVKYPDRAEKVAAVRARLIPPPRELEDVRKPQGYVSAARAAVMLHTSRRRLARYCAAVPRVWVNGAVYYELAALQLTARFQLVSLPPTPPPGFITADEACAMLGTSRAVLSMVQHRVQMCYGFTGRRVAFFSRADIQQITNERTPKCTKDIQP